MRADPIVRRRARQAFWRRQQNGGWQRVFERQFSLRIARERAAARDHYGEEAAYWQHCGLRELVRPRTADDDRRVRPFSGNGQPLMCNIGIDEGLNMGAALKAACDPDADPGRHRPPRRPGAPPIYSLRGPVDLWRAQLPGPVRREGIMG